MTQPLPNSSISFDAPIELVLSRSAALGLVFALVFGGAMIIPFFLDLPLLMSIALSAAAWYAWHRAMRLHCFRNMPASVTKITFDGRDKPSIYFFGSTEPVKAKLQDIFLNPYLTMLRVKHLQGKGSVNIIIPRDAVDDVQVFALLRARLSLQTPD